MCPVREKQVTELAGVLWLHVSGKEAQEPAHAIERERELADGLRAHNTALGLAGRYELDDVIDPAETREVVIRFLNSLPPVPHRTGRKRTIDNW